MIEYQGETYYSLRELLTWCGLCAVAAVCLAEAARAALRRPARLPRVVLAAALAGVPLGQPRWHGLRREPIVEQLDQRRRLAGGQDDPQAGIPGQHGRAAPGKRDDRAHPFDSLCLAAPERG
jgi:hypothetical protein